ncbi:MAG: hypothetical protein A3I65_10665 [Betaproteobacteria bacterium RIFCSPLOWO2_02_FULL_68_150]|nr:MAG: hypothetical protein A3I65_10665 [Betaproteobacteria bacterium RIFCSPLOWO2_02_FULL_68_150]
MGAIRANLQAVSARIERAARAAGRDPGAVRLLAVAKTHPAALVDEAYQAGQLAFGENYVQEALGKMDALACLPLEWHLIGPLQSNKAPPQQLPELAHAVAALPRLRLRGLMAIPEPARDVALQRARFRVARELLERLAAEGLALDTLSIGMSEDLEAAIAEGSTLVRVGSAIFGARQSARDAA